MSEFAPITLGRTLRVAQSESFSFTETEHHPRTSLACHAHENPAISFVIAGVRTYRFSGRSFDCRAGSAVFVPAGAPHSSHFAAERARGLMLEVRRPVAAPHALFNEPRRAVDHDAPARCDDIRLEMSLADDLSVLALESLAFELLASEMRAATDVRPPRWLERVRELLHVAFKAPPPLAAIATAAGVDRSSLTRQFRRHFRASIGEYVRAVRCRRARSLVACSDLPLSEVAAECGYADQSHLTRAFRRTYAVTPAQLRRAFKTRRGAMHTMHPCAPS